MTASPAAAVTQSTETVVLARAEWETVLHEGMLEKVQPIPETWFDCRKMQGLLPTGNIIALLACPRCRNANAIASNITRIDGLGKMSPRFICGFSTCRFTAEIYLDKFHDKPLYALSLENGERIEISYTHASSVAEASRGIGGKLRAGWRVVAIAPAIGFHVAAGSKGSVLIA